MQEIFEGEPMLTIDLTEEDMELEDSIKEVINDNYELDDIEIEELIQDDIKIKG